MDSMKTSPTTKIWKKMGTNFKQMKMIYMWEMVLIGYVKNHERNISLFNGKFKTAQRACGVGKLVGNKGGLQLYFNYNEKYYNFIGCHLFHGQNNRVKRDEMIEELI